MRRKKYKRLAGGISGFFRNSTMKTQFVLLYLLFVIIPAMAAISVMFNISDERITESVLKSADETVTQAGANISFKFRQMSNILQTIRTNSDVRGILAREDSDVLTDYYDVKALRKFLAEMSNVAGNLNIRMFIEDDKMYSSERVNFYPFEEFYSRHGVEERMRGLPLYIWSYEENDGAGVICYAAPMYGMEDVVKVSAYVEISMRFSDIGDILSKVNLSGDSNYYIADENLNIVYGEEREAVEQALKEKGAEGAAGVFSHKGRYYASAEIEPSGWRVIYPVEAENLLTVNSNDYFKLLITIAVIFAVLFLIVILFIMLAMSNYYDKKIKNIVHNLEDTDFADIEGALYDKTSNLNLLADNTNKLILKVKSLTEKYVQAELNEKKAELKTLQWQINPHFLYNALDTVNWAAIKRGDQGTSKMISLIAQYFRLVLSNGSSNISLSEELEFCRVYLQIQREINPGKFNFTIDAAGLTRNIVLPKMTIQPFVENALIHGVLKNREAEGEITISVIQSADCTTVRVADNGSGFNVSQLNYRSYKEGGDGFGLHNVYERLRIYLDSEPEFRFCSDESGTTAEIILKI